MFRVIHKHVFNYVRHYEILSGLQSGFISRDSTVNHLVDTYNTFSKSLDEGKEVPAVFCDIRVWYRGFFSLNLNILVFLILYYYGSEILS